MEPDDEISFSPCEKEWEKFVSEHPWGNIFQSPLLYRLFMAIPCHEPGVIAVCDRKGTIKGVLAWVIIYSAGMRRLFSTRSIITGGPLAKNDNADITDLLIKTYLKQIRGKGVIYTQIRNLHSTQSYREIFLRNKFHYDDHLTIHIDLRKTEEELIAEMHPKRHSNIRRARKKNMFIKELTEPDHVEAFARIIQHTYRRIRIPAPPVELIRQLRPILNGHSYLIAAYTDSGIIAGRAYLLYRNTIYDWYAGSDLSYSHFHANDLLPWTAMLWAKEQGYELYDFAGAGHPAKKYGVREYKKKFGGSLRNFGRYQRIHKPALYLAGKTAIALFKLIQYKS